MYKTVAITGVTGTLGRVVLQQFTRAGWRAHGFSRQGSDLAMMASVDTTDFAAVDEWMGKIGLVDAIVTCAGVSLVAHSESLSPEQWRDVIDTNLTGSFYTTQAAVQHGAKRIVFIGSIHGCTPTSYPKRAAYTASKAGIAGLTRALAVEWAPQGVAVNCVAPGHLPALMDGTGAGQALLDAAKAKTPTGKLATPDEVADVVFWLCNDAPMSLTGQIITVDGGFTLNTWPMGE